MKKIIQILLFMFSFHIWAQSNGGNVGIGNSNPDSSAALDLTNTQKKGFLLPRVSLLSNTDITTIPDPTAGLTIYNLADNGTGTAIVKADTFYFWDGTQWTDLADIITLRKELLPQIFFIAEKTFQNVIAGTDNVNTGNVLLTYNSGSILLNNGDNVSLVNTNNFRIENTGKYEISGYIGYNPNISATNIEYIIQSSSDNGGTWNNIAKSTGVWGNGTGTNNRTINIAPVVVTLQKNNLIRSLVRKTKGSDHGFAARISAATGLTYSKLLKIQKID